VNLAIFEKKDRKLKLVFPGRKEGCHEEVIF
jgi:hypothetical protein